MKEWGSKEDDIYNDWAKKQLNNQIIKGTVSKLSTPAYNKLIKRIIETIS